MVEKILSERGRVSVDDRSNSLIVTDSDMAATRELALSYPVDPNIGQEPPLKQAINGLRGFLPLKPLFWVIDRILAARHKKAVS